MNSLFSKILAGLLLLIVLTGVLIYRPNSKVFADPVIIQQAQNSAASSSTTTSTGACKDTTSGTNPDGTPKVSTSKIQNCLDQSPIVNDLQNIVNFLSAAVGIIVIAVIILGGIQYTLAGDNPTATTAAKKRITNGLIALAAFIFTFAFLQWLIPGGIFK